MMEHENEGYHRMFSDDFSIGLFFPITTRSGAIPPMENQVSRAQYASERGFDALWFRDVPLFSPEFGDAGQIYDPWVFLSHIAAQTEEIALATGSIVLPLRHPLHVAKAAASVDQLSGGRLVLGVASGDRAAEYPAFGIDGETRGELFRESVRVLRAVWSEDYPEMETMFGRLDGSLDLIPKPTTESLPLLVTGYAQQSSDWIAEHGDGWVYYQEELEDLEEMVTEWRSATTQNKPLVQVMHVDLDEDPNADPTPIHQGFSAGSEWFLERMRAVRDLGVDHVMINIRSSERDPKTVIGEFGDEVINEMR